MESSAEFDELMRRIRAVVAATRQSGELSKADAPPSPVIGLPAAPPRPVRVTADTDDQAALELALAEAASMLPRAKHKNDVSGVPKILRPFYRNQGGFNGILLATVERLVEGNRRLQIQNAQLQTRMDVLESALERQHDWTSGIAAAHGQQQQRLAELEASMVEAGGLERVWAHHLASPRPRADDVARVPVDGQGSEEPDGTVLANLQAQLMAADVRADRLGEHLNNLQAQSDDLAERSADWHSHYRKTTAHHEALDQMARRLEERQHNDASYLKNQLWFLQRLVQPLLADKDAPVTHADQPTNGHDLDALYLAFEDAMRGTRAEVKERTRVYLPYMGAASAGSVERPILDLGCGRGEWLEILREAGLIATGVDLNTCMVEVCTERGFTVTLANALDHLGSLADGSCGAVTAFHLIEHLPFPVLIRFFRECRRVLQTGGVAIFETPNPYNVLVGSGYFYHDFTHQRPLPPTSTKFLAEQMGFSKVEILPLHPWDEAAKVHGEGDKALEWRFNELFYGPQDYALIATP